MWLLPLLPHVSRVAAHVYYRLTIGGDPVPARGPALLVANHPNSLLDPVLVAAAARRPVRFLAKAPLFTDPRIGFLVRASGAIPVYRRVDDPTAMARNTEMFSAVYEALAGGSAVGVFPEGTSHSDPALAPLKTGAARMALGGYRRSGSRFPIIPIGLVMRRKDAFRSGARVIVGTAIEWEDLAALGPEDATAVDELTARIDRSLRLVTVNLEHWADGPLAECAVRVWEAEFGVIGSEPAGEAGRIARLERATTLLARVRAEPEQWTEQLLADIGSHRRRLDKLRLRPSDLGADVSLARGWRWTLGHLPWLALPAALIAILGASAFWPPYRATSFIAARMQPDRDELSTYKLLVGIVLYAAWVVAVVALIAVLAGLAWAAGTLILLPAIGMVGLIIRERWRGAWRDARRFFLLRSRRRLIAGLTNRQREIAARLAALLRAEEGEERE